MSLPAPTRVGVDTNFPEISFHGLVGKKIQCVKGAGTDTRIQFFNTETNTYANKDVMTSPAWMMAWQGFKPRTFSRRRVVATGERSSTTATEPTNLCLWVTDIETETITPIMMDNTCDCNEGIGVFEYGDYIIFGERSKGGGDAHSNYPNGSGLWRVHKNDILDKAKYVRFHEDSPNYREAKCILGFKGKIYVVYIKTAGATGNAVLKEIDPTTWSVTIIKTWTGVDFVEATIFQDKFVVAYKHPTTGNAILEYTTDMVNWTTKDTGIASWGVPYINGLEVPDLLVILIANAWVPNCTYKLVVTKDLTTFIQGANQNGCPTDSQGGCLYLSPYLFVAVRYQTKSAQCAIDRYSLDAGTIISIKSPSTIRRNEPHDLEATLTDLAGTPLAGRTVDFYKYVSPNWWQRIKVGSARTGSDGKAKVSTTADVEGKHIYEALFGGISSPEVYTNAPSSAESTTEVSGEVSGEYLLAMMPIFAVIIVAIALVVGIVWLTTRRRRV